VGQCSDVADAERSEERAHSEARSSVAGLTSGQEEAVPGSLIEGVDRSTPPTARGTAQPVPAVADMPWLGLWPPSGIWGF
jgi:hypothetical protein